MAAARASVLRRRPQATVAAVAVLVVVGVAVPDLGQLAAGLAATACSGWAAYRRRGRERWWRLLVAGGMTGWTAGQVTWAGLGYLALLCFAGAALLVLAAGARPPAPAADLLGPAAALSRWSRLRHRAVLALDGLVVIGSLILLAWSTALSVSGSVLAYLVDACLVAAPALVAVAALSTPDTRSARPVPELAGLLLPYLPLTATGVLVGAKTVTGDGPEPVEIYLGLLVAGLVGLRQMITLVENAALLDRFADAQRRLAHQAFHDPLTGLANRTLFRDRLAVAVARGRRGRLALVLVDLDDFKAVNDSVGHRAGDQILREVGDRLQATVPDAVTVAKLGEDEFGVLLYPELPEHVGERVQAELRRPFHVDGRTLTVRASVCVVTADPAEPGLTADALLRRAAAAMDTGKRRGNGTLVRYEPAVAAAIGNPDLPNLLAAALRQGVGGDGVAVHYQPIVRMDDGRTVAVEALARWTSPVLGPVPADVFVAAAERAGLVGELDNLVLDQACHEVAALAADSGPPLRVHVNVCASRLCDPELETVVCDTLRRHSLPSDQLVLEITETSRIPDLATAAEVAQRLRDRGVRLAIDDFGTGFNTLAELHLVPVDMVKLAQSYTAVEEQEPRRVAALCRSVVSISRALGITVIAEGVETPGQAGTLARLGCNLGQGYLYGRSAPLNTLFPARRP